MLRKNIYYFLKIFGLTLVINKVIRAVVGLFLKEFYYKTGL